MSTPAAGQAPIVASAPGKVVLWGEYAVLAGAPALVMAVDRRARCQISINADRDQPEGLITASGWHFSSLGFNAPATWLSASDLSAATPPAPDSPGWMAWHVLRELVIDRLPPRGAVEIDTRGFYLGGTKLGLGSSAAVCTALYGAFCNCLDQQADFGTIASIHHALQGNRGSGIDVAAAWFGGMLRFQRPQASAVLPDVAPAGLPPGLQLRFVWAGHPATTTTHLQRFADWQARGETGELAALVAASADVFMATDFEAALHHYVVCLGELDRAAGLTIYDAAHLELHQLAATCGVIYKPCGAGGGDIGAAFSYDARALDRFETLAEARRFTPIKLETAAHGIQVRR